MEAYASQAKLFKVLMHPARLAILNLLRGGEECVCHMEAYLGYRQAYISQQLMVLREAGLVEDRRDRWNIFYRVVKPEVYDVIDAAARVAGEGPLDLPLALFERACPCPKCKPVAETNAQS